MSIGKTGPVSARHAPMNFTRTPDDRFASLLDWPFEPNYTMVRSTADAETPDLRIAHAEAGDDRSGETVLMMHGEPSWSYLYRHMIPPVAAAGHRVIAPDLVGFGRSDKPLDRSDYTYARHVDWMSQWLVANELDNITLFCQDWGGLIGLRLVAAFPDRFSRVIAGNTFLPTGDGSPSEAFVAWRDFSQSVPVFPTGDILNGGSLRELSAEEIAAYDAPFPDEALKAGARQFPTLVPTSSDDPERPANLAAWEVLSQWTKPFICCFSDGDAVTKGNDLAFQKRIPGCADQPHVTVSGGHFLQEDSPAELIQVILAALA
jgi:haloalkane dehalogenase